MEPLNTYLPENRIAIVANGQEEITPDLVWAIKTCRTVIAVDGGLNMCLEHKIDVQFLVGDLDSIDQNVVSQFKNVTIKKLDRAKDIVDLEAGIQLAQEIDSLAIPIVFNGLGSRTDHHVNNLYLLLKYPKVILYSCDAVVLAKNPQCAIHKNTFPLLDVVFAFYEKVKLKIQEELQILEAGKTLLLTNNASLEVVEGELLLFASLASKTLNIATILPLENISFPIRGEKEDIFLLNSIQNEIDFDTLPGMTISLIPWLGTVEGIETTGLKWNLKGDAMSKDFIGISNIALKDSVNISIKTGQLLCIVEKNLIDHEMIALVDYSSTARFT